MVYCQNCPLQKHWHAQTSSSFRCFHGINAPRCNSTDPGSNSGSVSTPSLSNYSSPFGIVDKWLYVEHRETKCGHSNVTGALTWDSARFYPQQSEISSLNAAKMGANTTRTIAYASQLYQLCALPF